MCLTTGTLTGACGAINQADQDAGASPPQLELLDRARRRFACGHCPYKDGEGCDGVDLDAMAFRPRTGAGTVR